jgi:purine-binding chemotaxis protein CheW
MPKKKDDSAKTPKRAAAAAAAKTEAPSGDPDDKDALAEDSGAVDDPAAGTAPPVGVDRVVVFTMDSQRYALPIDVVQEIQQIVLLSELPDASPAVAGVINLRGQVVPALDLRKLVGVPSKDYDLQTPMIFARTSQGVVALIADAVEDVVDVPPGSVQAPSKVYQLADKLLGVCRLGDTLVFIFDIDALVPADAATAGRP